MWDHFSATETRQLRIPPPQNGEQLMIVHQGMWVHDQACIYMRIVLEVFSASSVRQLEDLKEYNHFLIVRPHHIGT
jgi:hypothetical protein